MNDLAPPIVSTTLDAIGHTPMVKLQKLVPQGSADVLVKLEYFNPTGSYKDRMALAMIEEAEKRGDLVPGMTVVEYTGGSTGSSLAFVCAVKRIPLQIVTSDVFSKEKRDHMTALGARLTLVASPTGGTTKALTLEMIETHRVTVLAAVTTLAIHVDGSAIVATLSPLWRDHYDLSYSDQNFESEAGFSVLRDELEPRSWRCSVGRWEVGFPPPEGGDLS